MATTRRRRTSGAFNRATQVAESMTAQEQQVINVPNMMTTIPLEQIQVPEHRTRLLNAEHVQELQDSIAVVGLGQPLITDQAYRLIAGGHRLAAIQKLQADQPETFKQQFPSNTVPIRIYNFDALQEPHRAQQIEIVENEKRRDYTPAEVKALAQRYIEQGYSQASHRPKKDEKALIPALQSYFRLSRRTIQRYLNSSEAPEKTDSSLSASRDALTPKGRRIKGYIDSLQRVRTFLKQEKQKGVRSLDHIIEHLELLLRTEQSS